MRRTGGFCDMGTLWAERGAFVLPDCARLGQRTIRLQAIDERDGTVREIPGEDPYRRRRRRQNKYQRQIRPRPPSIRPQLKSLLSAYGALCPAQCSTPRYALHGPTSFRYWEAITRDS